MNNVPGKPILSAPFKTLPEFELLQKFYPREKWLLMGTLTHARPTSAETQLRHFRELVHAIGKPNNTFGHRLHWVCRVGGGAGTSRHTHLHFLLSKHQITDGNRFSYNPDHLIAFIQDSFKQFGMKEHQEIRVFDSSRPGVEYVLRDESPNQERMVEMSQGLISTIKKAQKSYKLAEKRDPLAAEIITILKARGVRAGFGDEMDSIRLRASA